MFEAEAVRLHHVLGPLALRIDHHGSTAVPGLAAKPVIDIQISVATLRPLESYGRPLESLGVSGHALGFPSGATAAEPAPNGFRAARYKGSIEIDIPIGEWETLEEFTPDMGWRPVG